MAIRTKYIQDHVTGELIEVPVDFQGKPRASEDKASYYILGDLPDFRSPIDGKWYSGRAGLREHCKLHNVVPTADLKGLPIKTKAQEYKPDRKAINETIRRVMYQKGYLK